MPYFNPSDVEEHRCRIPSVWGYHPTRYWYCDECGHAFFLSTLPIRDILPGESVDQWQRKPEFDRSMPVV